MKVLLIALVLCGSAAGFMEDLFLEDPDFSMEYDSYEDYDYDDDETPTTTSTTSPLEIPYVGNMNDTIKEYNHPAVPPGIDIILVEETYKVKPKNCSLNDEVDQLKGQIGSLKDDIGGKISGLEKDIRENTASVTNVLDSMDVVAGVMSELKEMIESGSYQEPTTPVPNIRNEGRSNCKRPFKWEGGGCFYLEEYIKKTWNEAVHFCREMGSSLAEPDDLPRLSRHLDKKIGEYGTRVRWPLWLGGQRLLSSGTDSWFWLKKETKIPSNFWIGGSLRDDWNCLALDGYNEYRPISLECRVKRRFLCEKKTTW